MPDLRKKIFLESGKTVSRKARSRPESTRGSPGNSPVTSRNGSRANSRANSRYASEEEDLTESEYDDSVASSIINSDDGEDVVATWPDRLHFRMEALIDRKRSNAKGRESTLTAYTHIIRHHYAAEYVESRFSELIPALLKSIRSSNNTDETLAALKALAMTILSIQSETVYGHVYSTLKGVCHDSGEASIKVAAIEAMCITTMCGGGSLAEAEELMEYLLEIIESDGHSIGAGDNGSVVSAALAGWGFVATNLEDLHDQSELALDAFTEQLDSTDVDVQIAAGTNIALIFEAAREHEEETEESWNVHYDHHKLLQRMIALAKESSKSISKKNRKHLHASFNSVLTSLELGKGPGYSTARRMGNPHTGGNKSDMSQDYKEFGYREKIRLHNISMVVDSIKDLLSTAQVEFVSAPKGKRNDTSKNGRGKQTSKGMNFDDTDY
ncbi:interferon-related developmental regulator-domain-containing protein [Biscogniauxia mediterranea]|nr:interferon-related developmental regulator-domain-containing protein [Biscogniauxia mediterranea]